MGESSARCRLFEEEEETTEHIINCKSIKGEGEKIEITTEKLAKLREMAKEQRLAIPDMNFQAVTSTKSIQILLKFPNS